MEKVGDIPAGMYSGREKGGDDGDAAEEEARDFADTMCLTCPATTSSVSPVTPRERRDAERRLRILPLLVARDRPGVVWGL